MPEFSTYEKQLTALLKAEVVCAELLGNGMTFDRLQYLPNGSFKKSYRSDIDSISDMENGIAITVNRDGIYDKIPEGVFHQTKGNSGTRVSDMVAEHKRYKAEEKNARRFFNPIEQEFFRYKLMVEENERSLTGSLQDENMLQLLRQFWNLEEALPQDAVNRFIQMLPWCATIKNNLFLTAQTLSFILNKNVVATEGVTEEQLVATENPLLGEGVLGMNMVAGCSCLEFSVVWNFSITDINAAEIAFYTPHHSYGKLLKKFEEYFLPIEVDAHYHYETKTEEETLANEVVLGYNLTL